MTMRLTLAKKIIGTILGVFILSTSVLMIMQHWLYARNVKHTLSAMEQSILDLKCDDAKDIMREVRIAVEGSLQRGEYKQFMRFAEKQKDLDEVRAFSFYNKEGAVELSSDAGRVGRTLDAGVFKLANEAGDLFVVDTEGTLSLYYPIRSDQDMRRLRPELTVGDFYGLLHLEFSKEQINRILSDARRVSENGSRQTAMAVVGGSLLAASLVVISALLVAARIARPVRRAAAALKDIGQGAGDLTKRLEVDSRDEIGELAQWFNTFMDKMQGMIRQLADNAARLGGEAVELSETATRLAGGADATTAQSAEVTAAAGEMTTNLNGMAACTEQMSNNVRTVATAVEEMTASISEVAKNAEQAAGVADRASGLADASNERIGQLGSAADEIGKVIEVIQEIAAQTNLLALNATIEAARAGEAGKGFSIVANEVKQLAKQTAEATEDIRVRIEGIQSSTSSVVQTIGEIGGVIATVNEVSRTIASAVEEQTITTKEIAQNVHQAAVAAEMVSKNLSESAAAGEGITKSISRVDHAAKDAAQGATQAQAASQEMSELASQLQGLVGQFKV